MKGFIGTYASTSKNGIYQFDFDEKLEQFTNCSLYQNDQDSKYLSIYDGILAYPTTSDAVKMIRNETVYAGGSEEHVSCHIVQDENYIYTANYHDGTVHRYQKNDTGIILDNTIFIQKNAGTHQVILQKDTIIVPCRLLDKIFIYNRNTLSLITIITLPEGSGPRQGVLSKDEQYLYLISENTCTVFYINLDSYQIEKTLPLLKLDQQGGGAAIRISDDYQFLYISVRDRNQIYVVNIKLWQVVQSISSGGDHPRDIALDPSNQFLFAANRFSNNVIVFKRDNESGKLKQVAQLNEIIEGVSIVFEGGNK